MSFNYLNRYRDEVSRCVRCGSCQPSCPTYTITGDESMVARGRVALVDAVMDGRLDITQGFSERINSCLDCRACVSVCPSGVRVDEIIYAAKVEIADKLGCNPFRRIMTRRMFAGGKTGNYLFRFLGMMKRLIYDPLPAVFPLPPQLKYRGKKRLLPDIGRTPLIESRGGVLGVGKKKGRVAFFAGCATNLMHQHIGEAVIDVLRHNGIETVLSRDEVCCGIPFLSNGDREKAEELMKRNIDLFTSMEVDAVVTCCATCGSTLKDYPLWIKDKKAEKLSSMVMDIHYYLAHYTDYQAGLGKINRRVTWHDPCHLSRGQGIKDEPREILASIPGVKFIEMKKPCHCCGFGGEVSFRDYAMSMAIASDKAEAVKSSGASELATGCPTCKIHIEDALNHHNIAIPVRHTVEYLAESYRSGKE